MKRNISLLTLDKGDVMRLLHSGVVAWRKYGAILIFIALIPTYLLCSHYIYGAVVALYMTVPCGIKMVNCKWYLWYPRQIYFATMAALAMWQ